MGYIPSILLHCFFVICAASITAQVDTSVVLACIASSWMAAALAFATMLSIFVWLLLVLEASFVVFWAWSTSFSSLFISLQRDLSVTGLVELPFATTAVAARRERKTAENCILMDWIGLDGERS